MKRLFVMAVLLLGVVSLYGCGSGGGGGSSLPVPADAVDSGGGDPQTPGITAGPPANITLQSALPAGTLLSQGGTTTVTATVLDATNKPVANGTLVNFVANGGTVTTSSSTVNGVATAKFESGSRSGSVTITASSGSATSQVSIQIDTGTAASIIVESVQPKTIGVFGSGIEDATLITFLVRDAAGNPAVDNTKVNFAIGIGLNGGEKLTATSATTAGGKVTVSLQSGTVAGTVSVVGTIENLTVSTVAQVTIVSNRPDAGRLTMGAETLNLAGGVTLGLQSKVHAYLGDRAGNVVPDGTPVSFISECGTIGESGGFETTTTFGVASAVFQTSSPTVPELGGVTPLGNPGLCRMVAYTPGKGTFIDQNGNGIFDSGVDTCTTQMDEPYIDANDSRKWEVGEYYVDINKNGKFDTNVVNCQDDSMIWASMNLLISDYAAPLMLDPPSFNLSIGEAEVFRFNLADLHGNALVAGTKVSVSADGGKLAGVTDLTMADTIGAGYFNDQDNNIDNRLTFALFSDTKADAEPKAVTVRVTITPPSSSPQGNNGASTFDVASGMINLPIAAKPGARVFLSDSLVFGGQLAQGENVTIKAVAWDSNGDLVPNGTEIRFFTTAGAITASATTTNGEATATFTAPYSGGPVIISAFSPSASSTHAITVANGDAATILLESVNPEQIGVRGSGLGDTSTIRFAVADEKGLPVPDGTTVNFSIKTPLGGGERLSATTAKTIGGKVSTILQSGVRSGTAAITGSITATDGTLVSTVARVVIAAGLPDSKHFSLSAVTLNLPGYTYYGETSEIRAYLADRYSNPVPESTPIFFESEAGAMVLSAVTTNNMGQAVATHVTQLPYPNTISAVTTLPGLSKILAWTAGQESFVDLNGNGRYDSGEPFQDIGEPFIDANDNGQYDAAASVANEERYVDLNGNGKYDGPNGVWDGETFIWATHNILWSYANPSNIVLKVTAGASCPDFVIPKGQGCECTVSVTDSNGSPIVGGSTLSVTTSVSSGSFTLSPSSFGVPDATRPGPDTTEFIFTITNSQVGGTDLAYPLTVTLDVPAVGGSAAFSKTKTITFTLKP